MATMMVQFRTTTKRQWKIVTTMEPRVNDGQTGPNMDGLDNDRGMAMVTLVTAVSSMITTVQITALSMITTIR